MLGYRLGQQTQECPQVPQKKLAQEVSECPYSMSPF